QLATIRGHTGDVSDVRFSPDGLRLATAGSDAARIWDVAESIEATSRPLGDHRGWAFRACYSGDGSLLATGGWGIVRVRDAATDRVLDEYSTGRFDGVRGLTFDADGRRLWIGHEKTADLVVVDVATGARSRYPSDPVEYLAADPRGRYVAVAHNQGAVRLLDAATGKLVRTLGDHHEGGAATVLFSRDGAYLASLARDGVVRLWDVGTAALILRHEGGGTPFSASDCLEGLAFSPDGRRLAAVGTDGTAHVWDIGSGREVLVLRGHSGRVFAVAYLGAFGERIVTGGQDHTVKLWDPTTGECIFTLRGHGGAVLD